VASDGHLLTRRFIARLLQWQNPAEFGAQFLNALRGDVRRERLEEEEFRAPVWYAKYFHEKWQLRC
jgi:hypothetical protein